MIKVKFSLVVTAPSHGRISEHQGEDISCNPTLVISNSTANFPKARCAGRFPTLVVIFKFADCNLDRFALARSSYDAFGFYKRRQGDLPHLFFSMPSTSRKILLSLWQGGNVFAY